MWLRRGIALTLALVMTASLSVSALAAPSVEEAGEDTVLSQTQPDSDSRVPAEGPEGLENGSQAADSLPMIPLEPAEQASSDTAAETEEDIKLTAPGSGLRFDSEEGEYVQVQGAIEIPNTVEVWLKLDENENRRQIIMNNYGRGGTTWGIEVTTNNTLRYWDQAGPNHDYKFSDIEICTGDWMLISVVRDNSAKELRVYVDGELRNTTEVSGFGSGTLDSWLCFGSDYHSTPLLLDGKIAEVRMWDDVRTEEEIAEYAGKTVTGEEEGLAHAWDFRDVEEPVYRNRVFPDLVQGGVDVQAVGYAEDPETIYAVNFDLGIAGEDNEPAPPQEIKVGGLVKEPEPPKLEGFVFTGWYKDASCTQKWDFASDKVAGNTTLYAGWKYDYQPASFPEDMTGVSFCGPEDQLAMEDRLSKVPLSFEATVKLPEALDGRGGVIIGSWMDAGYYDYDLGYVSLEVYENGAPRLYWHQERRNQPNGGVQSVVFSGVDLRQGEWIHLAVTFDPEKDTVSCYINGVLVSTVEDCEFEPVVPAQALKIGGDYRGTGGQVYDKGYNDQYFRGEIANISVWSDVRTAEQIQADVQALQADAAAVPAEGETLLASWQFDGEQDLYEDRSDRDNDVAAFVDWIDPGFAQGDYSMVALPDTQFLSEKYPDIYKKLTQWIVDHEQTYNIQAVMHMGDMVNSGNSTQWSNCADAMYLLDKSDSIDWMPMRGNHDDSNGFNQAFPYEEFASRDCFGGSYEHEILGQDKLDCNYWEVTVGDRAYLILSLGWAPTQDKLDWADKIIKANPDKNVIVTTHAFMYWDGTHLNDEDLDYTSGYTQDGMDGSEIWEQLGKKNENVVLAIGGHIGFPDVIARTDENGAGEEVTSLLCDAQGIDLDYGLGMMMLLTFHEGSDQVDVNWYSAEEGKLFRTRNQFSITVPHVGENDGSGSGGSSSDNERTYAIVTGDDGHGSVTVSADEASAGTRITVTVKPDSGYVLDELTITDAKNKDLKVTKRSETTYTFYMADSKVTVDASFIGDGAAEKPDARFDDVSANAYYADAVEWAVSKGITSGTSANTFNPDASCTRAQMVTFLWRANGSPKADRANPFTDVSAEAYYYDAVLWAVEQGITSGTSATTFSPDATVNRGQTVTFLWRANGSPMVDYAMSFTDVDANAYYAGAVRWAVSEGITSGTSGNSFSPNADCTRAQIVTFLYQDMAN
jgi:uncharacterized repeat protein (TIGR02543 family)